MDIKGKKVKLSIWVRLQQPYEVVSILTICAAHVILPFMLYRIQQAKNGLELSHHRIIEVHRV